MRMAGMHEAVRNALLTYDPTGIMSHVSEGRHIVGIPDNSHSLLFSMLTGKPIEKQPEGIITLFESEVKTGALAGVQLPAERPNEFVKLRSKLLSAKNTHFRVVTTYNPHGYIGSTRFSTNVYPVGGKEMRIHYITSGSLRDAVRVHTLAVCEINAPRKK
jgi:hypothetical protein